MYVDLIKTFQFEAAHETAWEGDAARLHGHSFVVEIIVSGPCDPHLAWLIDYAEISSRFEDLYGLLDHKTLNGVEGLDDATLPGIRAWLLERLGPRLEGLKDVRVSVRGDQIFAPKLLHADAITGLPERIRFGFEAAHALPRLPSAHKCHTMHGHSFTVEAGADHAEALTPHLHDIYTRLDHRCLNEIDGLANPTSEELSRWIWNALEAVGCDPEVVIVAETCTARCVYRGR